MQLVRQSFHATSPRQIAVFPSVEKKIMDPHNHHVIGLQMRLNHLVIPTRPTIAKHCPRIPSTSPLIDADLALSQFERFFPPKNYSALTFP